MITDSPAFNSSSKNKVLNNIARLNSSINPTWSKEDHFKSALKSNIPLAVKLQEIKEEIIEKFDVTEKSISTNDLYGILKGDIKDYGKKISRSQLQDAQLIKDVETDRFEDDVIFYARLMEYFKNTAVRSYKAVKEIFRLMWNPDFDFNKDRFLYNLDKEGYKIFTDKVEEHRRVIMTLANHKRRGRFAKMEKPEEDLKSLEVA